MLIKLNKFEKCKIFSCFMLNADSYREPPKTQKNNNSNHRHLQYSWARGRNIETYQSNPIEIAC